MRDHTNLKSMEKGCSNPFTDDVFVEFPDQVPGIRQIHEDQFHHIVEAVERLATQRGIDAPADLLGRTILLTAPRAGFGKTHLSARIRNHVRQEAIALNLEMDPSRPISWPAMLTSLLRQSERESGSREPEISRFEEAGRFLLAQLVLSHLASGSLSPDDCPEEAGRLRSHFAEIFSPNHESGMLTWLDKRSRRLCLDVEPGFLEALRIGQGELVFWIRLLIDFHRRGEDALGSLRGLSAGEARQRMLQWLRLSSHYQPLLLLADGLDGFFRSGTAGMEIAELLTGIRDSVPRSLILISLNEDIWNTVFEGHLPSAWMDRLAGDTNQLHPIAPDAARALVYRRLERCDLLQANANRFIETLETAHQWKSTDTKLYPRLVLQQGRRLWDERAAEFLQDEGKETERSLEEEIAEKQISDLTDKVDFFESLQDSVEDVEPSPAPSAGFHPPAKPEEKEASPAQIENPFFAPVRASEPVGLAGIDSIIADIRGSGSRVVSEGATEEKNADSITLGDLQIRPLAPASPSISTSTPRVSLPPLAEPEEPARPASRSDQESFESELRELETKILEEPGLTLDLPRVANLLRVAAAQHPGLHQTEERFPSSRSACLRWHVRNQFVLLGFEEPGNVYFWNNLLQQSIASDRNEKIIAFSHSSDPFDPELFANFGFSPGIVASNIDLVELSDRDLARIYATEKLLDSESRSRSPETTLQNVSRSLDPLWKRIASIS
ncbi:MAG: hypothetical protein AAGC68_10775 [Verrucomicrobiota bacterium]